MNKQTSITKSIFTKEIEMQLQEQYREMENNPDIDYFDQKVICRIYHPYCFWSWYIINQDPEDPNYLWAIVSGQEVEVGSVSKSDLDGEIYGHPFMVDINFKPTLSKAVYQTLLNIIE